jgi:hypothetical protein
MSYSKNPLPTRKTIFEQEKIAKQKAIEWLKKQKNK